MYYIKNERAKSELDIGNFKKAIELYEHDLRHSPNSDNYAALYCELGQCYFLAEAPYNNANKAVALLNKAIGMDYHFAKSWLAFCYIFGDGVPVNLQKATDLLREADEHGKRVGNIDPFADFVLCKLVNLRLLLELCKRGQGAFVGHVLSDTTRMTFFMEATATWKANGHNIKVGTDFIMPSVYDVWKQVFGSVYDDSQYHNPKLLEWTRYFHYKKGVPKDGVIWPIFLVAIGLDEARKVYRVAIDCLVEMTKAGFSIY